MRVGSPKTSCVCSPVGNVWSTWLVKVWNICWYHPGSLCNMEEQSSFFVSDGLITGSTFAGGVSSFRVGGGGYVVARGGVVTSRVGGGGCESQLLDTAQGGVTIHT